MTRLHVDWTRCDGHGACAEVLPETFTSDEWGYPIARSGERDPAIDDSALQRARHAVRACPLMALRIIES